MFHEVFTDIPDFKASNAKYHTEETERIQKRFTTIFSKNTGKTSKEIIEKFYKNENNLDVFMTATQAKKFGIIDKIISGKNKKKRVKKNK
jgi:ATP-dependent protease ClpP protease subunit